MKTKTFLLLCLFIGSGLTQLFAQDWPLPPPENKNGTGTINVIEPVFYWIPVYLEDGTFFDNLVGQGTIHYKYKYHNGTLISANYVFKDSELQFENQSTDEIFKASDVGKQVLYSLDPLDGLSTFHFNFIGNYGTHIKGEGTWDWATGEFTWGKIVWLGKKN